MCWGRGEEDHPLEDVISYNLGLCVCPASVLKDVPHRRESSAFGELSGF